MSESGISLLKRICARPLGSLRKALRTASDFKGSTLAVGMAIYLLTPAAMAQSTANYSYDSLGRLWRVDMGNGAVIVYSYDAAGNRTGEQVDGSYIGVTSGDWHFGTVQQNAAATPRVLQIKNLGNAPMTVSSVAGLSAPFMLSGNTCTAVTAGSSCSLTLSLSTASVGNVTQNLRLIGPGNPLELVAKANVTASGAVAELTSGNLAFGSVAQNSPSPSRIITFRNSGTAPMTLTGLSGLAAPFALAVSENQCSMPVAPAASCSMTVRMSTSQPGNWSQAVMTLGAGTNASLTASGTVTGLSVATLQSGDLAFGTVNRSAAVSARTLTFKNTGSAPMTLTGLTGLSLPFAVTTNGCTAVAANGTCTMSVAASTATAGNVSQPVTTAGAATNASLTASINVVVPATPALSLTQLSKTSPTNSPTAATVTYQVGNSGGAAAGSISYAGFAGVSLSTGPSSCAANTANCGSITVTSGTAANTYAGTLTATPNTGTAATTSVSLVVNNPTAAKLVLGTCTTNSPAVFPGKATLICALSNSGGTAITSFSHTFSPAFSGQPGTSVSLPSSCAPNAACGNMVFSVLGTGTVVGGLQINSSGGTVSTYVPGLQVNSAPSLSLTLTSSSSPAVSPTAATATYRVGNSGGTAASSISYAGFAGVSLGAGPGSCAANTADCGSITVTSGTAVTTYAGTLTATPNIGTGANAAVNLVVNAPPTPPNLTLTVINSSSPTTSPTAATVTYKVGNSGGTAASSISYAGFAGVSLGAGPSSCAANTANCGSITVTSGTAAATYAGTLTASPNTGTAASAAVNLQVNPSPPALALTLTSSTSPSAAGTVATATYRVSNSGGTAATGIAYSGFSGVSVGSGPSSCPASTGDCGSITVTSGSSPGTYSGLLRATPGNGGATQASVNLVVNNPTPAKLELGACTTNSPVIFPEKATLTCALSNSGGTAITSFSHTFSPAFSGQPGTSVSLPSSCAPNAACGNMVFSVLGTGTVVGGLQINSSGGTVSTYVPGLQVNSGPSLSLTLTSSSSPSTSPTAATATYRVGNSGGTAASSISYAGFAGVSLGAGPSSCAASTADCGSITVTSGTAAATYAGTLTATPNIGTGANAAVNLVVNAPPSLTLSVAETSGWTTSPMSATVTYQVGNSGGTAASSISYAGFAGVSLGAGPSSCAANTANCGSITVTTGTAAGTYSGTVTATPNAGTAASANIFLVVNPSPPALALTLTSSTSPSASGTAATAIYRVSNSGGRAAADIAYSGFAGVSLGSGPSSCPANSSDCGSITVTSGSSPGTYGGLLRATLGSGGAAQASVNLVVNNPTPAKLELGACTTNSPTVSPTPATLTCALSNSGGTAITSFSHTFAPAFSGQPGVSVSLPSNCAPSAACGNMVFSVLGQGTVVGSLQINSSGGTVSTYVPGLQVNPAPTPASLTLTAMSSSGPTTSPTAATVTYRVGNSGGTAASSISYAGFAGVSLGAGPSSCAANTADCGSITVTSGTAAATYAGTLTATPNTGTAANAAINLQVNAAPGSGTTLSVSPLSRSFGAVPDGGVRSVSFTVTNTGSAPATGLSVGRVSGSWLQFSLGSNGCGSTLAPGQQCMFSVTYIAECPAGTRSVIYGVTASNVASAVNVTLSGSAAATSCGGGGGPIP